ncbi:hypothetical protein OH76DRAFT_709815 [Lentinus brumalis]|uniref:Uncharacterized protein n=1 Tax=Lentinus brumalis TaxID=2498619 RepID=A0A371D5C2_9APHY|nr:hypothetical protein OH76DRAFT_709815 [Polyporus brumalis]
MPTAIDRSKPPHDIVIHFRDFVQVIPLDDDGKPVPQDPPELLKRLMPRDKMVFAPTPQIDNLFDPQPSKPALSNDLSSFTQVFIYTLLRQRDVAGLMTYAESVLYHNMLETDGLKLRSNRASQSSDVQACAGLLRRDQINSARRPRPALWDDNAWAKEEARQRLGDMVSIMQWVGSLLQVNEFQAFRYRWPGSTELYEGDPEKASGEYAHYMGEFREMSEDYDEVHARRCAALEERGAARVREAEQQEAGARARA